MRRIEQSGLIAASFRDVSPFEVIVPQTLDEALSAMAKAEGPVPYAGGTHLCAAVRDGAEIGTLVWLKHLDALRGVDRAGDVLTIGALTTHHDGASAAATAAIPGLADAWKRIANVRVRQTATAGGNLMARHCRYEMSIRSTAMGGVARFATQDGEIALTPQDIWDGKVPERSLLTRIEVPLTAGLRLDYERSLRPIVTQALALWTDAGAALAGAP